MPRTAYLIPGRGSKWGGRCRDVRRRFRRRFRRFRFRRLRSPGWVAAGGRATHPPASRPAGWPHSPHSPHSPHLVRKKSSIPKTQDLPKKFSRWVFCNFLPCLPEPRRKVYIPVFQGAGDWKINLFLWIYFFLFFWKTRKTREIVSLEVGFWKIDKKNWFECVSICKV